MQLKQKLKSWNLMTQEILDSIKYHAYRLLWHNLSRGVQAFTARSVLYHSWCHDHCWQTPLPF